MRIVHVMDHSLPGTDGYVIRAKYLTEAQAAAGHEVVVLTSPSQAAPAIEETIAGVQYRRSRYSRLEQALVARGAKHAVFGRAIARRLGELLDEQACDLVHAHTPFTVARAVMREAGRRGLPWVYEKRNLWEESARERGKASGRWPWYNLSRALDLAVTQRAGAVCTITEALKADTIARGVPAAKVFVVGNGVDTDAFVPMAAPADLRALCLRGGSLAIGFVGSFFRFEGLPLLVEAFEALHREHPGARLVLVGDGEDKARVETLVAERGLQDCVWLTSRVPHAKVNEFCAAMDVMVYPRLRSPLTDMISPLKPLEPMAMARCVIGSNVGGIRELVRDGQTGLLFQAGSQRDLQGKLAMLMTGEVDAAALGARAREFVVAHRQWRDMARCYEAAYRCAIAASTGSAVAGELR